MKHVELINGKDFTVTEQGVITFHKPPLKDQKFYLTHGGLVTDSVTITMTITNWQYFRRLVSAAARCAFASLQRGATHRRGR